jgi:hypothetical protein
VGWAFYAYGNLPDDARFGVHIDDQPANCWDAQEKAAGPPRD